MESSARRNPRFPPHRINDKVMTAFKPETRRREPDA